MQWVLAKRAAPCALVAHDHEGRCAFAKALADVRAAGLFAHRDQFVLTQDVFDFVETRARAAGFDANPIGFFQHLAGHDFDRNARDFVR